jgi:hypothetical protein
MKLWMRWEASRQPFNAAEAGRKTIMDRLFSNSALLIPAKLHEAALLEGFRPERRTAIYLIYDLIVQKCTRMKTKWAFISDRSFLKVVKNHTRKSTEKKWLEENGFIQIKKWRSEDGTLKNSKIPGRQCQGYKIVEQKGDCILVDLWERRLAWPSYTQDDRFCQYTRDVLGQVELDEARVARICSGQSEFSSLSLARRMAILHWARTLRVGSGAIRRGRRVNRLYSPWTSAPRELRRACCLAGEPIVSIDLQASQPALIGLLAEDERFLRACFNDELYGEVGKLFAVGRDEAKLIFLSYIYGRNRKQTARNNRAFLVQEYVAKEFPKTYSFVWDSKLQNYTAFACRLQNLEAELFLDGIFSEMMQQQMPALTVHDSIAVPMSRQEGAMEICQTVLGRTLGGKARMKVNQYGTGQEFAITI